MTCCCLKPAGGHTRQSQRQIRARRVHLTGAAVAVLILAKCRLAASASGDVVVGRLPDIMGRALRHSELGPPSRTRRSISSRVSRRTADLTCRFSALYIPVTVRGTGRRTPPNHQLLRVCSHWGRRRVTHPRAPLGGIFCPLSNIRYNFLNT